MKDMLPDYIQTEDPSFIRDTHSKALLNTDTSALARHRRALAKTKATKGEVMEFRARLDSMEEKLDRLFDLLKR